MHSYWASSTHKPGTKSWSWLAAWQRPKAACWKRVTCKSTKLASSRRDTETSCPRYLCESVNKRGKPWQDSEATSLIYWWSRTCVVSQLMHMLLASVKWAKVCRSYYKHSMESAIRTRFSVYSRMKVASNGKNVCMYVYMYVYIYIYMSIYKQLLHLFVCLHFFA